MSRVEIHLFKILNMCRALKYAAACILAQPVELFI